MESPLVDFAIRFSGEVEKDLAASRRVAFERTKRAIIARSLECKIAASLDTFCETFFSHFSRGIVAVCCTATMRGK
jgi:hypothetical protein